MEQTPPPLSDNVYPENSLPITEVNKPNAILSSGNKNFLPKIVVAFASSIFIFNIFLLLVFIFALVDEYLNLCFYGNGFWSISVSCPRFFGWYSLFFELINVIALGVAFGVFIPPLILFVIFYIFVVKKIQKKLTDTENLDEIKSMKTLLKSLFLFPVLLGIVFALIIGHSPSANSNTLSRKQINAIKKSKQAMEQRIEQKAEGGGNLCINAPENIFLTPHQPTAPQSYSNRPWLNFPIGYRDGIGIIQVSRENTFDWSTDDSEFIIYTSELTNFSSKNITALNIKNNSMPDIKVGQRYDIKISLINKDSIPELFDKAVGIPLPVEKEFIFRDGTFFEKNNNSNQFPVSSSTRVTREACLSVGVRDSGSIQRNFYRVQ